MLKLAKYLKPFALLLVFAIALLFLQAMTDLALPDYMANIVNVGIQQGGIEKAVPDAVTKENMNKLMTFLSDADKKIIEDNYILIDKENSDYSKYVKDYPALEKDSIYILKDISKEEKKLLNPIMAKALSTVLFLDKAKENAKDGQIDLNGQKLPADTDLFALLSQMPQEQRLKMSEDMNKKYSELGDTMLNQIGANAVKDEYVALGMDTDSIQSRYIIRNGVIMLLVSLLGALCTVGIGFLASRIASGIARDIRKDVFTKVEGFSNSEFDKFSTASLITRTTNDINQIAMLIILGVRMVIYAPIVGIWGVLKAVNRSVSMSWIIALAVAILLILIATVFVVALPKFKAVQGFIDKLNLVTRENLSGMMVIRAFNTQHFEEQRFDKANVDLTKTNLFVNRVMAVMFPVMMLVMNGVTALIVWVGAHQIADSSMQVGDMMAFMQYAIQILIAFLMMSFMFIMIPRAAVSAQRVSEVLDTQVSILDPIAPKSFGNNVKGTIEFRNVSFKYPGAEENALSNISFTAENGKTTAIIGATGSGKTTLINLIPRFYDVSGGEILLDGTNIMDVSQHDLREYIGYIPQKGFLFQGTIESNLKYARETASQQEIEEAASISQSEEFIGQMEKGYQTEISQGGSNVSGGQKQRLSIARALVKDAPVYIFDDSFSALDFRTDAALRKALKERTKNKTLLIVAQRISTIRNADQIVVLEEGKIVGMGTHNELMQSCETYSEIALSQLSKEELA